MIIYITTAYRIYSTFGSDFNLVVWQFWLRSPNLMYANTTYNHVYYETMYTQYHPFAKPDNVHYVPILQNYWPPNILCIQYLITNSSFQL